MERTFCDYCEKEIGFTEPLVVEITKQTFGIIKINDTICYKCFRKLKRKIKEIIEEQTK